MDITADNDVSFDVTFTNISYKVKLLQLTFDQDTLDDVKIFTTRVQHQNKELINDSPNSMTTELSFTVSTKNHFNLTINSLQSSFKTRMDSSTYSRFDGKN